MTEPGYNSPDSLLPNTVLSTFIDFGRKISHLFNLHNNYANTYIQMDVWIYMCMCVSFLLLL